MVQSDSVYKGCAFLPIRRQTSSAYGERPRFYHAAKGLVLDDLALIVQVEFAVKILARGNADNAFEVAGQMALIKESSLKRRLRQRSSIANQLARVSDAHLSLVFMGRKARAVMENAQQVKGAQIR